ncbi:DUF7507 domain-containing protein [Paenibacillus chitinolyticus]|uniref:DUF7507 domain-containing protein n=1 Tax=Paenibacillus chitinolyticus TaxID=79263 RepID=UPI003D033511
MAFLQRYAANQTGAITFTGNTLGLSRSETAGVPGTVDSIGAYITTDTTLQYGTYPAGTTSLYTSNGSAAVLTLPAGSTVLYAELIWGGSYLDGTVNNTAFINNPITFTTPAGTSSVTQDAATVYNVTFAVSPNSVLAYVRTANVTALVSAGGAGTYTAKSIVGTLAVPDPTANHAGWTLAVVYQNPSLPFRNLSLGVGAEIVQSTSGAVNVVISGFATPAQGTLKGRALISAQEGDANKTGDQALFGPTASSLTALSGANNFAANFFASQINKDDGTLDTSGTFGTRNAVNGAPGTLISGGRQGWDITNVDISSTLKNAQTSAILQLTTSGDGYIVNANAIQIDINAPLVAVTKTASVTGAVIGDTVTFTIAVRNTGLVDASSTVLTDPIPTGSALVANSVTVNGTARTGTDPSAGILLGTISAGSTTTVTFRVTVTSLPSPAQLSNQATASFSFQSVAGGPVISGSVPSNTLAVPVYQPVVGLVKTANTSTATVGDTVTYTLTAANTGSIRAAATLTDPIPAGSTFVTGSVTVNGTSLPAANPATGFSIGNIDAGGGVVTVTFQTIVTAVPAGGRLIDQGTVSYTFSPPDGRTLSGSAVSNTLSIPVSAPNVTVVKTAGSTDAVVGDTLTYTITATNNGITAVTGVVVSDPIPGGSSFVTGSVTVNGTAVPAANPATGVPVASIAAGSSAVVTFRVNVTTVPSPAQLSNQATVSFSSGAFTGSSLSNTITLPVYQAVVSAVKSVSPASATVGATLTYTVTVKNSGNLPVSLNVSDPIPAGSTFLAGSVTVNGTPLPAANPAAGFAAGSLAASASSVITFQTVVTSLPATSRLVDQATASYTYQPPDGRTLSGSAVSNEVSVPVSAPNVTAVKSVSNTAATVGDVITYTVVAANGSSVPVTSVVITDPIPAGTTFNAGSVTVNGTAVPAANPAVGVPVGAIAAGASTTLQFKVAVTSVPSPATLGNQATVSFTAGAFTGSSVSNTVSVPVYQPVLSAVKSADTAKATVGDSVTYTVSLTNSGNYNASITLTDPIPAGSSFAPNSVTVNGLPLAGADPVTGISVGTVSPGTSSTVTFQTVVNSLPSPPQLSDQAAAAYTYRLPDGRTLTGTVSSNTLTIPVTAPNVSVVKTASATDAVIGDTVTYTIAVANNGIEAVSGVVVTDPIPAGSSFVTGSVNVRGAPLPTANPVAGIPVGSIAAGASAAVTFAVQVNTLPSPPQLSNQASASFTSGAFSGTAVSDLLIVPVYQPVLAAVKSAGASRVTVGDTVTYTVTVTNSGNLSAQLTVTDPIPAGSSFVANSVTVGGVPVPGANPATGIATGAAGPGAAVTVTFQTVVNTLPAPPVLTDQAQVSYTYRPPDGRSLTGSVSSNSVTLPVSLPNVTIVKSPSAPDAIPGDVITYTLTVSNSGTGAVSNVVVTDPIPVGSVFVTGSVKVNGTAVPAVNPANGISAGTLAAGASSTVVFSVQVTSLPSPPQLVNQATVSYTSGSFSGSAASNTVSLPVYQPIVTVKKSANLSQGTVGDLVTYSITASNGGNIGVTASFTDPIPAGSSLVSNSVALNQVPLPGANPAGGIAAGTLAPGASTTLTFQVVITSVPTPPQLVDQAAVSYTYQPPDGRTVSGSASSNTVVIPVSAPNVVISKSASAADAVVGDTIVYTLVAVNNGIENVTNVIVTDSIPDGTTLVPGSVTVNSVPVPGANPSAGVPAGLIVPGGAAAVTFSVLVNSLPASGQLVNRGSVSFTSGTLSFSSLSNTVTVPVYQSILSIAKSANTVNATVGDTITYTLVLSNSGNIAASTTVTDLIPAGSALLENSVTVNGSPRAGADPSAGIPVGSVAPGVPVTVTFQTVVNSVPASSILLDQASASFVFAPPDGRSVTGSAVSNTLVIPVSAPNVTVTLTTASTDAVLGDIVSYTITATNNGIENVTGVLATDSIPAGSVFVPGSVVLNGTSLPSANPSVGVPVGIIAPGASAVLSFQTSVTSLPSPPVLSNKAIVSFTSGAFTGSSTSGTVLVPVYQPILAAVKTANFSNATVGDTIAYTIAVTNSGNIAASLIVTDPVPPGSTFLANSVLVNGLPLPGADPTTGIAAGSLLPGATTLVSFETVVDSVPPSSRLNDQAAVAFTFQPPDGRTISESVSSNPVTIPVSAPNVTVTKTAGSTDAVVGDTIAYTITATNSGIENVANVVISDPIPAGSVLVPGSVTLNGLPVPAGNPAAGIPAGIIAPGASAVLRFRVTVTSLPSPAQLLDQATVSFTSGAFTGSSVSAPLSIPVYQPLITLAKSGNSTNATVGDTITYSILVTNSGNIAAAATITDPIPAGSAFFVNSVAVNGTSYPGSDPSAGIAVGSIAPGSSTLVTFQVIVTSVPVPPSLINQASASFTFVPPDGRIIQESAVSNVVSIPVSAPDILVTKTAGSTDAAVGDTITYTITASNAGISGVTSVIVTDPIPTGSVLVPGSVTVNGTVKPGADPAAGIAVGSVAPGAVATVSFQVTVTSLPSPPVLSNQARVSYTSGAFSGSSLSDPVVIGVYQPVLSVTKSANTANATVGDTIVYTILATNSGDIAAVTTITDPIPAGSAFIANSVVVNGQPIPGADPTAGIAVGPIPPAGTAGVTFQVVVTSVPSPPTLVDQATAAFTFQPPDGRTLSGTALSNAVSIPVSAPNVTVGKSASAADAVFGDTVTYTITAANNGIEAVTGVIVTDPIPAGSVFVPGSVTLGGVPLPLARPDAGINAGTIAAGATATVTFQVTVTSLPSPPVLSNQAAVSFTSGTFSSTSYSDPVTVPLYQPILQLAKSANFSNVTVGDTLTYTIQTTNSGNIAAALLISDPIPAGSQFIENSVSVNGIPVPGASPVAGINAGSVLPGSTASVMFQVLVTSVPNPQQLTDQATAAFTFLPPDGRTVNGSAVSNTLSIPVSAPNVSVVKGTTAADAIFGDIVTYSIAVTNNGIEAVTDTVVTDPIPPGSVFVPGSVTVGGTVKPGTSPVTGIPLGTLTSGSTTVVTFQVTVQSLPTPPQLYNQASVAFTSGAFTFSSVSNPVVVPIFQPILTVAKSGSSDNATVGDTVTYTIVLTNTGNLAASASVTDPIPPGSSFVPNSVTLNGIPLPGTDPVTGIPTGSIAPGGTAAVTFQVLVTAVPVPPLLIDQAAAQFTFVSPDGRTNTGSGASNTVIVSVSTIPVIAVKETDLRSSILGDTILYTITVTNKDADFIREVVLTDPLPQGSAFVKGSVTVDGIALSDADPNTGIAIGQLASGASVSVSFQASVVSLPSPPELTNQAVVTFVSGDEAGSIVSNSVTVPVLQPVLSVQKTGDTDSVAAGDAVLYMITVTNTGSTGAFTTITDVLPSETTLVPDSVTVNGIVIPGADPAAGITVGTIAPGASASVSFRVRVTVIPPEGVLVNRALSAFSFQTPDGRTHEGSSASEPVVIPVTPHSVSLFKNSTVKAAALGDVLAFGITVTNGGQAPAADMIVTDLLPEGTSFVPGSVTVDGTALPDAQPQAGIALGSVPPQSTVLIGFQLEIASIPEAAQIVNTASASFTYADHSYTVFASSDAIFVYKYRIEAVKSSDQTIATIGSEIAYNVVVTNTGTIDANSIVLTDRLPAGTQLDAGSIRIDGQLQPGADLSAGLSLPSLEPGGSASVSYSVTVTEQPPSGQIENQAEIESSYVLPDGKTVWEVVSSNLIGISVQSPVILAEKSASPGIRVLGDVVEYAVAIRNSGTLAANVILQDLLPPGSAYVPDSVTVNGEPRPAADPSDLAIGLLAPGSAVTAAFRLTITSLPAEGLLRNRATAKFTYRLPDETNIYTRAAASNEVVLPVFAPAVLIDLNVDSHEAASGDILTYTAVITNTSRAPIVEIVTENNLPAGLAFVSGSVRINGMSAPNADITAGIPLGELQDGESTTVQFAVAILPATHGLVTLRQTAGFSVRLPDNRLISGSQQSNPVTIRIVQHEE